MLLPAFNRSCSAAPYPTASEYQKISLMGCWGSKELTSLAETFIAQLLPARHGEVSLKTWQPRRQGRKMVSIRTSSQARVTQRSCLRTYIHKDPRSVIVKASSNSYLIASPHPVPLSLLLELVLGPQGIVQYPFPTIPRTAVGTLL